MFLCSSCSPHEFNLFRGNSGNEPAADRAAFSVNLEHDRYDSVQAQIEMLPKHFDNKLHRSEVVVEENDVRISVEFLSGRLRLGQIGPTDAMCYVAGNSETRSTVATQLLHGRAFLLTEDRDQRIRAVYHALADERPERGKNPYRHSPERAPNSSRSRNTSASSVHENNRTLNDSLEFHGSLRIDLRGCQQLRASCLELLPRDWRVARRH